MNLKIGCDPEMFLRNPNSGKFVSAEGIVPGDKLNPHKVKKGTVQVDGFAAEIGIDPASTPTEFADNVETVLDELKKYTGGYELVFQDYVVFDEDVFSNQSAEGRKLGCEPDFNAYTRVSNPTPIPNPQSLRTASGHIHIGWMDKGDVSDVGHFMDCIAVSKQMDVFLGAPSLFWGINSVRRTLYGKAGSFRVKPYGVEYRTLDNGWLKNRKRMEFVCANAIAGMQRLFMGEHLYNNMPAYSYIEGTPSFTKIKRHLEHLNIDYLIDGPEDINDKKKRVSNFDNHWKEAADQLLENLAR